jgi:hypothetical protein
MLELRGGNSVERRKTVLQATEPQSRCGVLNSRSEAGDDCVWRTVIADERHRMREMVTTDLSSHEIRFRSPKNSFCKRNKDAIGKRQS